jgi:hypothetical protein
MDEVSAIIAPRILSSEARSKKPCSEPQQDDTVLLAASTTTQEQHRNVASTLIDACMVQDEYRGFFSIRFMQLIRESDFEFGFSTPADEYVRTALDSYGTFAREWICDLYLQNIRDSFIMSGILRVIAHFGYRQMYPEGMLMALTALQHQDSGVRECGVRCFENWEDPECLNVLKSLSFPEDWLKDYLKGVISDLERLDNHAIRR